MHIPHENVLLSPGEMPAASQGHWGHLRQSACEIRNRSAISSVHCAAQVLLLLDRRNTCLFTCSAIAFAEYYSLILPGPWTSSLQLWAASTKARLSDRLLQVSKHGGMIRWEQRFSM